METHPIHQLFYVSRSVGLQDAASIHDILHAARRNNARSDVTGCLLFSGLYFAQVLEGDRDVVCATLARIVKDDRHAEVRVLLERDVGLREYEQWSMGYMHDLTLEDDVRGTILSRGQSIEGLSKLMARMRTDAVVGAL